MGSYMSFVVPRQTASSMAIVYGVTHHISLLLFNYFLHNWLHFCIFYETCRLSSTLPDIDISADILVAEHLVYKIYFVFSKCAYFVHACFICFYCIWFHYHTKLVKFLISCLSLLVVQICSQLAI